MFGNTEEANTSRRSAHGTSTEIVRRWQDDARCRDVDPAIFWPEGGDLRAAAALCASCPVIGDCLDASDWGEEAVFRAGLTGIQRKNLRRSERSPVSVRHCAQCGGGFIGTEWSRYCGTACRRAGRSIAANKARNERRRIARGSSA